MSVRPDPSRVAIAPSILSADFARLGDDVREVERAGADLIHVDVMDGHFVPNITIGPPVVAALRKVTRLPLDVHLMIEHPERFVEDFARAGADVIGVHVEACVHLHGVLQQIRAAGARPEVVINPHTPISLIEHVLEEVDMVLVMSVNPGFGGQAFISQALGKIEALAERIARRGLDVDIEVDGGIKVANSGTVAQAGATVLVAGSAIFGSDDYRETIENMRQEAGRRSGRQS